jgi:ABC-type transporter Mla maintaining outer membrane lipid asymmetry permease subunit MlaE
MPLYPGSATKTFGLGLWNSVPGTITVEILMFVAGLWIYARATRARDAIGRRGLSALAGFLLVIYVGNAIGPPPPSVAAIVVAGSVGAAVIVWWACWVDRHRSPVG